MIFEQKKADAPRYYPERLSVPHQLPTSRNPAARAHVAGRPWSNPGGPKMSGATVSADLSPPTVEPVRGARAIAELLGLKEKQVYRLVEGAAEMADPIPAKKVPLIGICGDRQTLLRWWARQVGASVA